MVQMGGIGGMGGDGFMAGFMTGMKAGLGIRVHLIHHQYL